ncbi:hypothetical protein CPC16_000572 [Podila verticillata]|nr:hypothetical protein CPC16_000572 [Podila verticillata]
MDNDQLQHQTRPSILSGEWMTLPTLSVPVEDEIDEDDEDNYSNTDEDTIGDKKRAERIETMERDIHALHDRGDTSISSQQDCALFLALFEKFLSSDNNVPLQQEMMVEVLEDFGELVLGPRKDPKHLEHLRRTITQMVS